MDSLPFIKVAALENGIEEQIIAVILKEQQIPYRIRSFHDTAYDGLFQVQKGWGEIYAPADCKADIIHIIEEIRAQNS